jgi:hypothetical protein
MKKIAQLIRPQLKATLCVLAAFMAASAATAGPGLSDAQAQYQRDRAACLSGQTNQDRATCLREAGAALVEARRNGLSTTSDSQFVQNRMDRCVPLPPADQEDCVRRMNGEGIVRGSVEEGGIYRELSRTIPMSELK